MTSMSARQLAVLAVERAEPLARARRPRPQLAAGEALEIEGVHRLPELQQHVVGDVDDVVDRADAGGLRGAPASTPATGPTVTSATARRVARAEIGVVDGDGQVRRGSRPEVPAESRHRYSPGPGSGR